MAEVEMKRATLLIGGLILVLVAAEGQVVPRLPLQDDRVAITDSCFQIRGPLKVILREFIKGNDCRRCYVELYVDRQTPDVVVLTLKSRNISPEYIKEQKPSLMVMVDGIAVHVHTGIENYLANSRPVSEIITPSTSRECETSVVSVRDSLGVITWGGICHPWGPFCPQVEIVPKIDSVRTH